jgi:hypothetical protein
MAPFKSVTSHLLLDHCFALDRSVASLSDHQTLGYLGGTAVLGIALHNKGRLAMKTLSFSGISSNEGLQFGDSFPLHVASQSWSILAAGCAPGAQDRCQVDEGVVITELKRLTRGWSPSAVVLSSLLSVRVCRSWPNLPVLCSVKAAVTKNFEPLSGLGLFAGFWRPLWQVERASEISGSKVTRECPFASSAS